MAPIEVEAERITPERLREAADSVRVHPDYPGTDLELFRVSVVQKLYRAAADEIDRMRVKADCLDAALTRALADVERLREAVRVLTEAATWATEKAWSDRDGVFTLDVSHKLEQALNHPTVKAVSNEATD